MNPLIICCFDRQKSAREEMEPEQAFIYLPKVTHGSLVLKTMPLIMTHLTSVSTTLFNRQSPRGMF